MLDGSVAAAGVNESGDRVAQLGELRELQLDSCELLGCLPSDARAGRALPSPQGQQLSRLREGKAQLGRATNEPESCDRIRPVPTIGPLAASGLHEKTDALVVAERLDPDPARASEPTDTHCLLGRHARSMGAVVDYRVKAFRGASAAR